jgi:L-ascorbate oxidase
MMNWPMRRAPRTHMFVLFVCFCVVQPGTFFYHGHFGMQRAAGLYGSLIVEATAEQDEPYRKDYDGGELSVLLSDWYHDNVYAQAAGLERKEKHFEWIGEPQVLLSADCRPKLCT